MMITSFHFCCKKQMYEGHFAWPEGYGEMKDRFKLGQLHVHM